MFKCSNDICTVPGTYFVYGNIFEVPRVLDLIDGKKEGVKKRKEQALLMVNSFQTFHSILIL